MSARNFSYLIGFLVLVFLVEYAGHILTFQSVGSWYLTLKKPNWTPPSWVFGPVWTFLFATIGVSGWLAFVSSKKRVYFVIYGMQLFFNLLWSYCFFFLQNPFLAMLDIFVLLILIFLNIVTFAKINKAAGLLLIPYFVWTCYASILNVAIWHLNR